MLWRMLAVLMLTATLAGPYGGCPGCCSSHAQQAQTRPVILQVTGMT
ncbi:hypothetical protein HRbin36_02723 [bacterium HR36]|nr:hypothetical protein HRbin36_02723 [bacterium HR36]